MNMTFMKNMRARGIYGLAALLTMGLGLLSRSDLVESPSFISLYVGDALWALLVFWLVCFLKPMWHFRAQLLAALSFAFLIEFSQLYHAPWIDQLRHTTLGGLVLGFGFQFSDLLAYTVGIVVGVLINEWFIRKS